MKLDGRRKYIDLGDQSKTCLGNLTMCLYGITISGFYKFHELEDDMYFIDSGPEGFKLYYKNGKLVSEFQQERNNWKTEWSDVRTGKWYFIEQSWCPRNGLKMYVDLHEVSRDPKPRLKDQGDGTHNLFLGRANSDMRTDKYAKVTMDHMEIWYADRDKLIDLGFIQRGKENIYIYIFHPIFLMHLFKTLKW